MTDAPAVHLFVTHEWHMVC